MVSAAALPGHAAEKPRSTPMRPGGGGRLQLPPLSKHGHSHAQPRTAQQRWSLESRAAEQQGEEDLNLSLHAAGSGAWGVTDCLGRSSSYSYL